MPGERVLIMAYFFPPAGGVSVQRALSLAKYLPAEGCRVDVLTTRNGVYPVTDNALLDQVPPHVQVHRAFTPEPPYKFRKRLWQQVEKPVQPASAGTSLLSNFQRLTREMVLNVLFPDPQVLWNRWAYAKGARLIEEHQFDTLVVTAPPFSSFMVGNQLKRRFPSLRLVSDFRDDWIGFFLNGVDSLVSVGKRESALRIERETVETSDLIVACTHATLQDIRSRYPAQPASKFAVVHNGYDPQSLRRAPPMGARGPSMVVTYVGTVYKPCSPRYYLDAVDSLPEEIRSKIETRFVGRVTDGEAQVLEGRKSPVKKIGFVPHAEALDQMAESDFLLLIIDDEKTQSQKIFEYLGTGKPVIALTPPQGESGRLIQATRAGHVVDPRDVAGIATLLQRLYAARGEGRHATEPDWDLIRQFERPQLAARYRRLIQGQQQSP
jgi:glycosyltransferase involved in cell wall biosynthesis